MELKSQVVMTLSPEQWESLMAVCLVAYGSDQLDVQDLAFCEEVILKGGGEIAEEDTDDQPEATNH